MLTLDDFLQNPELYDEVEEGQIKREEDIDVFNEPSSSTRLVSGDEYPLLDDYSSCVTTSDQVYQHQFEDQVQEQVKPAYYAQPVVKRKNAHEMALELFPSHPKMPQLVSLPKYILVGRQNPKRNQVQDLQAIESGLPFKVPRVERTNSQFHLEEPEITLVCSVCDEAFPSVVLLLDHRLFVHGQESMLECGQCYKVFEKRLDIRFHIILEAEIYKCVGCGMCFRTKNYLESHLENNKCPSFQKITDLICDTCQECYPSIDTLLEHRYDVHGMNEMLKCGVCHLEFDSKQEIMEHSRKEYGMFSCSKCNRTIKDRDLLKKHEHNCTVNESKNCICTLCSVAYHFPADLIIHREKDHGLESALVCGVCGLRCKTKYSIHRHLLREYQKFVYEEEDPFAEEESMFKISLENFTCSICNETFGTVKELVNHRRDEHGKASVLRCGYCNYKADSRTAMLNHLNKEYEVFKCKDCHRTFPDQSRLNSHVWKFRMTSCVADPEIAKMNFDAAGVPYRYEPTGRRPRTMRLPLMEKATRRAAEAHYEKYSEMFKNREMAKWQEEARSGSMLFSNYSSQPKEEVDDSEVIEVED